MTDRNLIDIAAQAMENSYAPYSKFKSGAALECLDGTVFAGCNIENASIGAAICAEAAALASAVSAGKTQFLRIAITSDSNAYCVPCGACRQLLAEFSREMEILCARADGRYVSYQLSALLPMAFGKEHIGNL